jgi:hypothetical protein
MLEFPEFLLILQKFIPMPRNEFWPANSEKSTLDICHPTPLQA